MFAKTLPSFALAAALAAPAAAQHAFWNFETPHVHPLELTPDGNLLLAVNTADQRLEVFFAGANLVHLHSVRVGMEPVSVRARTTGEVWVVNHLSDTVTVVDPLQGKTTAVLHTDDEPCDVAFAQGRAFVTCSQANTLLVFDPSDLSAEPERILLEGEDPRAAAVSPDGTQVYVAFFESGNATTILGGGFALPSPPIASNAVSDPDGPYGGVNPPPNAGDGFDPPISEDLPPPPPVSLVVRRDEEGRWFDDNEGDWTAFVSGELAGRSGRVPGWQLLDHDVAVVDAHSLEVSYRGGMMNACMAMAVHPSGTVHVVGTDARNEERFEPILSGRFLEVLSSRVDPATSEPPVRSSLNPHVGPETRTLPVDQRLLSVGDPRGIVWSSDGSFGFVSGMGSNNVVRIGGDGARLEPLATMDVGEGPTGLALKEGSNRLFVLNRFAASITVVDLATSRPIVDVPFHDPTSPAIKTGRKHLYDTHATSGTGAISCASCHIDARTDKLVWDLGDPTGEVKSFEGQNVVQFVTEDWHPMKGPTRTQTLQDIIGKEPFHWRGDRDGIEEFNGAFVSLMAADSGLTPEEMQEFEDFLATIRIPPNPFRKLDNTLREFLPLPGHFTSGAIGPQGLPLPPGNAVRGRDIFVDPDPNELSCASCHALPSGVGTDYRLTNGVFVPFPVGPNGEHHSRLVHLLGFTNHTLKPAQLRTLYENIGFDLRQPSVHVGFGFLHDGSIDTLSSFLAPFGIASGFFTDQDVADAIAFLGSFSGSDLPEGSPSTPNRPPGTPSLDAHAAIGQQVVLDGTAADADRAARLRTFLDLADAGEVGVVGHGYFAGIERGVYYLGDNAFASDRQAEILHVPDLMAFLSPASPTVWTVVPTEATVRMGVDRDADGVFDLDELENGTDPLDPTSFPCLYVPEAPAELQVTGVRRHGVDLVWEDRSFNESGYLVQYRVEGQEEFVTALTTEAGATSARVGMLTPGEHYELQVQAVNCAGESKGVIVSVTTSSERPVERREIGE